MTEELRLLLYPLGYLAQLLFGLRFIVQWLQSEQKKESIVPRSFWFFSCIGNLVLAMHGYLQLQFPLLFFQTVALFISLRNLDLLGKQRLSFSQTLSFGLTLLALVSGAFFWQSDRWMRAPGQEEQLLSPFLHLMGTVGLILFASRFWLQWWRAEKKQKSELSSSFWWMSVVGALLSLIYFIALKDPVNIVGYSLGMIPYIRNLKLMKKKRFSFTPRDLIFFLAAEKSGDHLGAKLLSSLKKKLPNSSFVGVGGEEMEKEGMKIHIPSHQFEVMGLTALFPAAFRLFRNFHKIKRLIRCEKPKMVVLIDYAEFNMLLAAALRKGGYHGKIVQYVIPSVWAWRKGRTKKLVRHCDLLLSILPFDVDHFPTQKEKVSYVGHPLREIAHSYPLLEKKSSLLALFPGSRLHEVKENLPLMLAMAKKILEKEPTVTIALSVASPKVEGLIQELATKAAIPYQLVPSQERHRLMREATFALATCGTVILELALFHTPTLVLYKISYLNYLVGRYLFQINLPYFSLPNILLQRELFPECVDKKITLSQLSLKVEELMQRRGMIAQGCQEMESLLKKGKNIEEELYALFMS